MMTTRNEKNALRAWAALKAIEEVGLYDEEISVCSQETFITDILADLMHFCDVEGIDFADLLRVAEMHFEAEQNGEDDA